MTPADVRALFPALQEYVWLNAAASSPLCTPVAQAMRGHVEECERHGDLGFPKWLAQKETVRARLAAFVGASPPEVAFTPSTSFGFHVIAQCLKARGVTEVLTLEHEFPSTTVPLLYDGLTVRGVRRRPDGSYPLEDLEAALRPTTGAVVASLVQFNSGFRVDVEGLAKLCRDRKLPLALNGAQALGHVPIDVHALGASFLSMTSHKWLGAGYGTGMLVVAEPWLDALPMAGWLSVKAESLWQAFPETTRTDDAQGFVARGTRVRREASALEGGGGLWLNCHALEAALDLHERVGVAKTLAHVQGLQRALRDGLRRRGFTPNAPDAPERSSGICVVPVQGPPEDVVRALIKARRVVTTPRGGGVRISTHVFNTGEDVEQLLQAFDAVGVKPA
ncbi:MAG: aminotransferase class V-fold PLP-dependent enzyme [Myxococcaceae bacterium]|nr:aminotransferase class V-fold PLP-dependent enzyme [Myxococcaceae bacterium]